MIAEHGRKAVVDGLNVALRGTRKPDEGRYVIGWSWFDADIIAANGDERQRPDLSALGDGLAVRADFVPPGRPTRLCPRGPGRSATSPTKAAARARFRAVPRAVTPIRRAAVNGVTGTGLASTARAKAITSEVRPRPRGDLISQGVTINGLPILEGHEANTLADWYQRNVVGGRGSFLLPAEGFDDFGRAIRRKFVFEISDNGTSRSWAAPVNITKFGER
jgi:Protein of unknown function (DUF1194)